MYVSPLKSAQWDMLAGRYNRIACIPAIWNWEIHVPFALLAADHGLTINAGQTSRADYFSRKRDREGLQQHLERGELDEKTLYVSAAKQKYSFFFKIDSTDSNTITGLLDGYPIIAPGIKKNLMDSSIIRFKKKQFSIPIF